MKKQVSLLLSIILFAMFSFTNSNAQCATPTLLNADPAGNNVFNLSWTSVPNVHTYYVFFDVDDCGPNLWINEHVAISDGSNSLALDLTNWFQTNNVDPNNLESLAFRIETLCFANGAFSTSGTSNEISYYCLLYTSPSPRD